MMTGEAGLKHGVRAAGPHQYHQARLLHTVRPQGSPQIIIIPSKKLRQSIVRLDLGNETMKAFNKFSGGYRYDALRGIKMIRLLDLQPASSFEDTLCCHLRQARLDDKQTYEALSYTWGEGKANCELQIDGATLLIKPNLEAALRFLRSDSEVRTLWIDAICINQRNLQEREQQIPLMRDIYHEASEVVAWIGEKDRADSAALDIEELQYRVIDATEEFATFKLENFITVLLRTMMSAMVLLRRPWFSRCWVIQEVARAQRLVLQCSDKKVRWSNFHALLKLLPLITDKEGTQIYFGEIFLERAEFVSSIRERDTARRSGDASDRGPESNVYEELQSLVSSARQFGASQQADHIYALLGLVEQKITKAFSVDYSTPFRTTYREFTRLLIETTHSLTVLGQIDKEAEEKAESWVPDWTTVSSIDPLSDLNDPYYSATGNSSVELIQSDDPRSLALKGIFIDTIERVSDGPTTDTIEALNPFQRFVVAGTKFGLTESAPLMPYKSISHLVPTEEHKDTESINTQPSVESFAIKRKPVASTASPVEAETDTESMAALTLQSTQSSQTTQSTHMSTMTDVATESITTLLARGIFTGLTRDIRVQHIHNVWGRIHPVNNTYMKAKLEESFMKILPKGTKYYTGGTMEDAYWRTLIGDKRTNAALHASSPPPFWQHAYSIWQSTLQEGQGNLSRFAREAGSRILKRGHSSSSTLHRADSIANQELRDYLQSENARRERLNRSSQLHVPAFRNIISTLIKLHNASSIGDEDIVPNVPNTTLISDLDNYDSLSPSHLLRLETTLAALPTARLTDDELRNQIDKAFWYDFIRVARNRQFCVTKKGLIGWVPAAAQKGDRVVLLQGGQVPYVLRPHKKKKGEWMFLGECYVHGVMRGEMWRGGEVTEIKLR